MRRLDVVVAVLASASWIVVGFAGPSRGEEGDAAAKTNAAVGTASGLAEKALDAMEGAEEIVFAVHSLYGDGHYYANFGYWSLDPSRMAYGPGGTRLCKLNLRTKKLTVLLDDREGSIRDPRVHYDGRKVLFSYRKGGTKHFHLYEINTDGTNLRELTSGPWDDIEPAYLPDGGIVFPSSRCNRFVACWYTPVAVLYRMDADGGNLRILSSNIVHDNTPSVLPDGRIMYTRWEYVDRAPQKFHGLWTMNPDGTGQMIMFGNTQPPGVFTLMIDAVPIPGTDKVVAIFSPGHGNREHAGHVTVVNLAAGPDDPARARRISPEVEMGKGGGWGRGGFRDPHPLSENCFLVARDKSLLILDGQGKTEEIYAAEDMVHDPRVIRPRPRERLIPRKSDPAQSTGQLVLANIYHGRKMQGVKRGEVKKLLVLEQLPKAVNFTGVQQTLSMNGTFTLKRILGTVPVEPDGSAYLEVPALRSLHFAALDEQGTAVKRMQSFLTVMPGETLACVGCHENRTETVGLNRDGNLMAMDRPPSRIEPIPDVPDVIDYPRDIQPIFDKHCVECHSPEKPDGRVVLTGDYNEWFTQSYYALFSSDQVSDSWGYDEDGNHQARGFGSAASALMKKIDGSHYDVKLSALQHRLVQLWIDTGATYPGTYGAYRPGTPPSSHTRPEPGAPHPVTYGAVNSKVVPEGGESLDAIVKRRCLTCHNADLPLGPGIHKTQRHLNVPRYCLNLYNLSHPEKSMILLAPLAKEAGGYEWCKAKSTDGKPGKPARVFANTEDPDYRAILQVIQRGKTQLAEIKRFDMPGSRPNKPYIREMKRYGVLPADFDPLKDPIDMYEVDRAYWRSLWHQPTSSTNEP